MNKLNLKVILTVIFDLILLGLLAFNGWMLWDFREQTGKTFQGQAAEQLAQFTQIQSNFDKTATQIAESMKPDAEIIASLGTFSKQSQDQHAEQAKIKEQFTTDIATVNQNIKQSQDKIAEAIQPLAEEINSMSDASLDIVVQVTELQKRVDNLATVQEGKFYIEGVKVIAEEPAGKSVDKQSDKPADKSAAKKTSKDKAAKSAASDNLKKSSQFHMEGVKKWDSGDVKGAIADFKQAVRLNADASGCYYNIALCHWRLKQTNEACDYAYQAGYSYLKNKDVKNARRMAELLNTINPGSDLIKKLRDQIPGAPVSE